MKVTEDKLNDLIEDVQFYHHDRKVTICFIKLKCDFYVTGESGVLDRSQFNKEIGESWALKNAFSKLWGLQGYLMASDAYLHEKANGKLPKNDIHEI